MFCHRRIDYFNFLACSHYLYAKCLYEVNRIKFYNNAIIQSRLQMIFKKSTPGKLKYPKKWQEQIRL